MNEKTSKQTVAIWIAYDGSEYCGWQRQPREKSIQEVIERALSKLLLQDVVIHASGRTDSGVHALGQCASFQAELIVPIENLKFALNNRLPKDIRIVHAVCVPADFHARFNALGKTYLYKVFISKETDPFRSRQYCQMSPPMDAFAVMEAMQYFLGTHDFSAFKASGSAVRDTIRTIIAFDLERRAGEDGDTWLFTITGDGFLYNMVRIIMGTLFRVGQGQLMPNEIPGIIESGERHLARWTAPAEGLYLKQVYYDVPYETLGPNQDERTLAVVKKLKKQSTRVKPGN
ncbi:MAG: tRNA pseudouridine38-40 synthase [Clostridiales bacterium]|nr:tRNA pseudouridine38-40 synthase [Clostridiales bacterium]